jgi:Ca2+-binding RTX toxin-like protein
VRRLAATAVCAFTCLTLAPNAFAATAFVGAGHRFGPGDVIWYLADPGEVNSVTIVDVFNATEEIEITDSGATINAGPGCTSLGPTQVRCPHGRGAIEVKLGDGNDFLSVSAGLDTALRGGDGNDTILGSGAGVGFSEYLSGGPGNDLLRGRGGSDVLDGGLGADELSGGSSIDCGLDICVQMMDTVTYAGRTNDVVADADGLADDGEALEGDLIRRNVENLVGGHGNDVLTGSTSKSTTRDPPFQTIWFGSWLQGRAGNDLLRGAPGRDSLVGGRGNDLVRGSRGADLILGSRGSDRLIGGRGQDHFWGGKGPDRLFARDGQADRVDGGLGRDKARIDSGLDRVRRVETFLP